LGVRVGVRERSRKLAVGTGLTLTHRLIGARIRRVRQTVALEELVVDDGLDAVGGCGRRLHHVSGRRDCVVHVGAASLRGASVSLTVESLVVVAPRVVTLKNKRHYFE
jgi:hypothetical protein